MTSRATPAVLASLLVAVTVSVSVAAPAQAIVECKTAPDKTTATPWWETRLQPRRVWGLTMGRGVVVAVVDSGVDVRQPHLRGRVIAGATYAPATGSPLADCAAHGTFVAGLIAGKVIPGKKFHGMAPGAKLLSIRQFAEQSNGQVRGNAAGMAQAIMYAVAHNARVINISATASDSYPGLRDAVAYAVQRDVLVVAAAGNDEADGDAARTTYPAAYPGVLAVASSDQTDHHFNGSHVAPYVDIAAPGEAIVSTGPPGKGLYATLPGTSFATALVSGTAALVRAYHPDLTATEVANRLMATADVPSGGRGGPEMGAGIVNPYAAVTAVIPVEEAADVPHPPPPKTGMPSVPSPPDHSVRDRALTIAAAAGLLAIMVVLIAAVIPRGRVRKWRPRRAGQ